MDDLIAAKELAFMLLASGKNFPVDAGRYALCTHHSSTPNGRYFLVTTALEGGPTVVPGFSGTVDPELGLCLPNKCSSEDIFQVVNNSAQQLLDYSLPYYPDAAVRIGSVSLSLSLSLSLPQTINQYHSLEQASPSPRP